MIDGTTAKEWDSHYSQGLGSGEGSVGEHRTWKWKMIDRYVYPLGSVLDAGCGDLSFWEGHDVGNYLGLDWSLDDIIRCVQQKTLHPEKWGFAQFDVDDLASPKMEYARRDTVMCLDVLFHIPTKKQVDAILKNLVKWTRHNLVIYNWIDGTLADGKRYFYWPLEEQRTLQAMNLRGREVNPHLPHGALYFYEQPYVEKQRRLV